MCRRSCRRLCDRQLHCTTTNTWQDDFCVHRIYMCIRYRDPTTSNMQHKILVNLNFGLAILYNLIYMFTFTQHPLTLVCVFGGCVDRWAFVCACISVYISFIMNGNGVYALTGMQCTQRSHSTHSVHNSYMNIRIHTLLYCFATSTLYYDIYLCFFLIITLPVEFRMLKPTHAHTSMIS